MAMGLAGTATATSREVEGELQICAAEILILSILMPMDSFLTFILKY